MELRRVVSDVDEERCAATAVRTALAGPCRYAAAAVADELPLPEGPCIRKPNDGYAQAASRR